MKHLHMYTTCADDSEQAQTNKKYRNNFENNVEVFEKTDVY